MLVSDKLGRFINVLGATVVGAAVMGAAMFVVARGMRMEGGGIAYTVLFIIATVVAYRGVKSVTDRYPALRAVIAVAGVGLIALMAANWRALGAEDPAVPLLVAAAFLGVGYMTTAPRTGGES